MRNAITIKARRQKYIDNKTRDIYVETLKSGKKTMGLKASKNFHYESRVDRQITKLPSLLRE